MHPMCCEPTSPIFRIRPRPPPYSPRMASVSSARSTGARRDLWRSSSSLSACSREFRTFASRTFASSSRHLIRHSVSTRSRRSSRRRGKFTSRRTPGGSLRRTGRSSFCARRSTRSRARVLSAKTDQSRIGSAGHPPGRDVRECKEVVMNRMVVLLALGGVACGAVASPASQPSPSTGPEGTAAMPAPAPPTIISQEGPATSSRADSASTGYATVTDQRLQHPADGDWLLYRRTYDGSGYRPLKQITAKNAANLSLAWSLSTDQVDAHETTPLVNHVRMFITTPQNNIIALDAKTGTELWRYAKKYPEGLFQLHPTNRGVALYGDRVYMATTDCQLAALDADTGAEAWTRPINDYKTGCYATLAPLAARGKILVGYSGGEFGGRGSVSAFDAADRKRNRRT